MIGAVLRVDGSHHGHQRLLQQACHGCDNDQGDQEPTSADEAEAIAQLREILPRRAPDARAVSEDRWSRPLDPGVRTPFSASV